MNGDKRQTNSTVDDRIKQRKTIRMRKKRRKKQLTLLTAFILAVAIIFSIVIFSGDKPNLEENLPAVGGNVIQEPDTSGPVTYTEATILSAGDVLAHLQQVDYAKAVGNGSYDFSNSFKFISSIVSSADYAVANLETTLSGESQGYSGFPAFNSPDSLLSAVKDAGFDMMLFANNHCYDRRLSGFIRTQKQIDEQGLSYIGAKKQPQDKAYQVVDIKGIKVGMLNYAEDLSGGNTERRTINGNLISDGDLDYMNLYNLSLLNELYADVDSAIADMRGEGADLIIAYMHWGLEYHTEHNSYQEQVAQALCDRGVDVIIGGHPHVIQDVDVLTDRAGTGHKTLCYYSLGNFVSNQNRLTLTGNSSAQYTEAGLMVQLTVRKYSTGEAMVVSARSIPTFVHRYKASNGFYAHEILPISNALADPAGYNLNASGFGKSNAADLYDFEINLLGDTVDKYNNSVQLPEGTPTE